MAGSQFTTEIKQVLATLDDPNLTAEGYYKSILRQIQEMKIPRERKAAMRSELAIAEKTVRELRARCDAFGLREAANVLFKAARALAQPLPTPKPADLVRQRHEPLQACGWASATIDLLATDLKPGEKIVSFDGDSVTPDKRRIDRLALIDRMRPHAMTDNHLESWRKQHTRPDFISREPAR